MRIIELDILDCIEHILAGRRSRVRLADAGLLHQGSNEQVQISHHGGFVLRLQPTRGINVGQCGTHSLRILRVMHRRVIGKRQLCSQFMGTCAIKTDPAVLPRLLLIGCVTDELAGPCKEQIPRAHFPGAATHLEYTLAGKHQMDQVMIPDAGAPGLPRSTAFDTAVENGQLNIVGIILLEGLLVYVRHSRVSSTLSYCRQLSARH